MRQPVPLTALVVLALAAVTAGCTSTTAATGPAVPGLLDPHPASTPAPATSSPAPSGSGLPGPSSPAASTSAPPSPGGAADGTNVGACQEGSCEVYVTGQVTIPLDPRFGFTQFVVTHDASAEVGVFGADSANGNLHATIGGTGTLDADDITMVVESDDAQGAVLRFSPRAG